MAKGVSPEAETTGKLTATYLVYVSVKEEGQIPEAAKELEAPLRRAVAESYPGQAECAVVRKVTNMPPPQGSGVRGVDRHGDGGDRPDGVAARRGSDGWPVRGHDGA